MLKPKPKMNQFDVRSRPHHHPQSIVADSKDAQSVKHQHTKEHKPYHKGHSAADNVAGRASQRSNGKANASLRVVTLNAMPIGALGLCAHRRARLPVYPIFF